MFISTKALIRLMKQTYKHGLTVANPGENRLYMGGKNWEMVYNFNLIPNEVKGEIIALCGDYPSIGERFTATKEGCQMEEFLDVDIDIKKYSTEIIMPKIVLTGRRGVREEVIRVPETGEIYLVPERAVNMIDNKGVEEENGECYAEDPRINETEGILWMNNCGMFRVSFILDGENPALKMLKEADWGIYAEAEEET